MTKKSRSDCRDAMGEDDIGCERNQFRCVFASVFGIDCRPAIVDAHVAADRPAQITQPLQECRDAGH